MKTVKNTDFNIKALLWLAVSTTTFTVAYLPLLIWEAIDN